jgi:hypothetical protein
MSSLLADVITDVIASGDDIEIVSGSCTLANLVEVSVRDDADFVILVGQSYQEASAYEDLLVRRPQMRVLVIVDAGRRGLLFEMRPSCASLGELSAKIVLDTIRSRRTRIGDGMADP